MTKEQALERLRTIVADADAAQGVGPADDLQVVMYVREIRALIVLLDD